MQRHRLLPLQEIAQCELCFLPAGTSGFLCPTCEQALPPDTLFIPNLPFIDFAFCSYALTLPISRYLVKLKDKRQLAMLPKLNWLMHQRPPSLPCSIDAVAYIPSGAERLLKRGFNPAEALARTAAKQLNIPVLANALIKAGGQDQRQLARKERFLNAKQSLQSAGLNLQQQKILIVEDVLTTGATASAAAKVLKEQGASWVGIWALAHTELPPK